MTDLRMHTRDLTARLAASAAATESPVTSDAEFEAWFAACRRRNAFEVTRIPLADMASWSIDARTGTIAHDTGKFFSVEGVRVRMADAGWDQPMLVQREIGILGILVADIGGVLHFLMQAKAEPGTPGVRVSPTINATRSNYTGVHRGRAIPYLDAFIAPDDDRVLVDTLQSERGAWFLRKRNRHMVIEAAEPVPEHENFCWLTLGQLRRLMHRDNVMSMEACSVLACLPTQPPASSLKAVVSRLCEIKARTEVGQRRIPLRDAAPWRLTGDEVSRPDGRYFRVIGADVRAGSREVAQWQQPLLAPVAGGVAAMLTQTIDGVPHLLLHARVEAGSLDVAEFGPTVLCTPSNYFEQKPRYLDEVLRARPRYDVVISEEGARFYEAASRYLIVSWTGGDAPDDMIWVSLPQAVALLRHGYYLNMQARTLVAAMQAL